MIERAPRFELRVPVHFSPKGAERWVQGETINVSRSGVCFRAATQPEADSELRFRLEMKAAGYGAWVADVVGEAHVVRSEFVGGCWVVGAQFWRYQFQAAAGLAGTIADGPRD